MRLPRIDTRDGPVVGGAEFEFILRSLMELRVQLEELRRKLEERHEPVHVIEVSDLGNPPTVAIPVTSLGPISAEEEPEPEAVVVYRDGMTMAEVERLTIETVLDQLKGNRRRAAQVLGIGERTLYRKLKEFGIA